MNPKIRLTLSTRKQYFVLHTGVEPRFMDAVLRKLLVSAPARYYQAGPIGRETPGMWKVPVHQDWYKNALGVLGDRLEVDPEVQEKMATLQHEAIETELIKAGKLNLTLPPDLPLVTKPFKHQEQALALLLKRKVFGLFMDMGTGKTKVVLDLCACLKQEAIKAKQQFKPMLVLAPVTVLEVWKRQGKIHQPGLMVEVLGGRTTADKGRHARDLFMSKSVDVVVISYESAWRTRELDNFKYSALVLDEATKIKSRSAKQAKGALKLGLNAERRYILTGTPMPNSPLELWNQVRFLDPYIFGNSFYLFRDTYAIMGGYQHHEVIGWKNLDQLSRKLSQISYMVKKADCLDLPPKIYQEYRVDMEYAWQQSYEEMAKHLVTEIQGTTISVEVLLAKLTKLRQMSSGFIYAPNTEEVVLRCKFENNPKVKQLINLVTEWTSQKHKCVIWGTFKEELNIIEEMLKKLLPEGGWVRIDGSVAQDERANLVEKFQSDPNCMVFLGQQRTGGLGITLTAASYCVFFSNDYSPEIRLQCEDRLHRIGQASSVTYVDLIARKTIDVAIYQMLKTKQKLTAIVEKHGLKGVVDGDEAIDDGQVSPESAGISGDRPGDQFLYGSTGPAEGTEGEGRD